MSYKFNPFTGTLDDVGPNNGNGVPGGTNTQVQFNDGGVFGGDVDFTYNKTSNLLTLGGDINLNDGGSFTTTLQCVTPTANRTISFPDATGTVGLVAGSSGQLLYNNAGANAGVPSSVVGATGNITLSLNGAASVPPVAVTGTWFVGTTPQVLIQPSNVGTAGAWSASGTGIGVNAASGFAGRLLDLQVNGTSRVQLDQGTQANGGRLTFANLAVSAQISANNSAGTSITWGNTNLTLDSSGFQFNTIYGATYLATDAANTLAQRNGTNAQTFRVYNTFTDASNYERGFLRWSSNVFEVGPEAAGTGTARPMRITAATLKLPNLPTYADNTAALAGGLVAGDVYKTSAGDLRITV